TLSKFHRIVGGALAVMVGDKLPSAEGVEERSVQLEEDAHGIRWHKLLLGRKGEGEQIPAVYLRGREFDGTIVVWVHPAGNASLVQEGKLVPAAQQLLAKKAGILAMDVFLTGEFQSAKAPAVDPKYAGFTFGYNRSLLANRVHDILPAVA